MFKQEVRTQLIGKTYQNGIGIVQVKCLVITNIWKFCFENKWQLTVSTVLDEILY